MYFALGVSILLVLFLALSSAGALVSASIWSLLRTRITHWPAASRARLLFTLRILPLGLALSTVVMLIGPAYVLHEPHSGGEVVSLKLALLALLSALGIAAVIIRGVASWRATMRLSRDWHSKAWAVSIHGANLPTYMIEHPFPVIAVVGIFRPRLFVANKVLDVLTAQEMNAALAHERGHLASRDNLKRALLRACRDLLLYIPWGRSLDREWVKASEEAADEFAATVRGELALDLASAVVKLARLIPAGARPTMEAAAIFLVGSDQKPTITRRVRRLMQLATTAPQSTSSRASKILVWFFLTLVMSFLSISLKFPAVLATIHGWTEHVVALLQ
jgi:Zn-dependent protease with chaperone function